MRSRPFLALVLLGAACTRAPTPPRTAAAVRVWVTTADRAQLLAPQPDLRFGAAGGSGLPRIEVDASRRFQTMAGFGAALTDASAWLVARRLSSAGRDSLLRDLFGPEPGIGLSVVRLTIGASDFSPAHYSLDDLAPGERDTALAHFSLEPLRGAVLPVMRRARELNPRLTVVASPWSAPAWMKTTGSLRGGTLREDAYGAFAEYLRRFATEMRAEGVPIDAITLQNEPHHEPADYPGMRLSPAQRAALVKGHVGPRLARGGLATRILEWDHNWSEPESPLAVLADPEARRWIAGVAWHCYGGDVSAQARVHDAHPDVETWFTECSGGGWAPDWGDNLLWTTRTLVVGAVRAWARAVLLWNLALDEASGPHLGGCGDCRGVVTVHAATGAVTRNEEYYALAHASRFARPGARRIASSTGVAGLETVAFRNADDGSLVLVVVNSSAEALTFAVVEGGRAFRAALPARAVATYTWRASR